MLVHQRVAEMDTSSINHPQLVDVQGFFMGKWWNMEMFIGKINELNDGCSMNFHEFPKKHPGCMRFFNSEPLFWAAISIAPYPSPFFLVHLVGIRSLRKAPFSPSLCYKDGEEFFRIPVRSPWPRFGNFLGTWAGWDLGWVWHATTTRFADPVLHRSARMTWRTTHLINGLVHPSDLPSGELT